MAAPPARWIQYREDDDPGSDLAVSCYHCTIWRKFCLRLKSHEDRGRSTALQRGVDPGPGFHVGCGSQEPVGRDARRGPQAQGWLAGGPGRHRRARGRRRQGGNADPGRPTARPVRRDFTIRWTVAALIFSLRDRGSTLYLCSNLPYQAAAAHLLSHENYITKY